jgi:hypothetical protein
MERKEMTRRTEVRGRWRGRAILSGLVMMATGLVVGPAGAQEVERLSGRDVSVYNLAGEVRIVPGTGSDVVVRVQRGGRDAARLTLERGSIGGRETLRVRYPSDEVIYPGMGARSSTNLQVRSDGTFSDGRGGGGDRVRVRGSGSGLEAWADLVIEVPAAKNTAVYLAVGPAEARGISGDLRIDTGSGNVTVRDVTGALTVDTGSGRVDLGGVRGDVFVDTGSGRITAAGLTGGQVELDTGSGGVTVEGVEASRLSVDTGSGEIRVSGVRSADVELDTGSGSIEVELLSDIDRFRVDTGSGSVTIRVPADFGAEVEVDTGSGRIDVDLPMRVQTARRDYLRGQIGDGGGRLSVDTGSGSIRITSGG